MARIRLSPEENQLWSRLAATVRPMRGRVLPPLGIALDKGTVQLKSPATVAGPAPKPLSKTIAIPRPGNTLDANWDKRLATGTAAPDRTIDLHGHSLASAHALLDRALGDAVRSGARLVLLITGRPSRDNPRMPPTGRGVIRASVADWIAAGSHAGRIAAVRNAHPRHGGQGALYIILRRART